jgi:hypothetical protein
MKAKRVFAAFSLLLIVGIGFFLAYFKITLKPVSRLEAEREIYAALIDENYALEEHTTLGDMDFSEQMIQYIKEEAPKVEDETLADFQKINSQSFLLSNYVPSKNNYVFLNRAEIEQFYNDWEAFSDQHPNLEVINSFSRVGFNSTFTQAIVLNGANAKIFDAPFEYSGGGTLHVLKRIGRKWIEQYQLVVWITG